MNVKNIDQYALVKELLAGKTSRLFKTFIFFMIKASPVWLIPIITARMIDLGTGSKPFSMVTLICYAVVAILLFLQNIPFHYLYIKNLSRIARGIGCDLRIRLCRQLQSLTLHYHSRHSIGKLHSKAIRDVETIETAPRLVIEQVFQFLFGTLIAVFAIVYRAPAALLFFLVMVPACALLHSYFSKKVRKSVNEYRKSVEGMSATLNDMMVMIPITRAHGLEEKQLQTVEEKIADVYDLGASFDRITSIFGACGWVTIGVMQIIFLSGSIYASVHGYITVGDVVMFNSFFMVLSGQLIGVLNVLPSFSQAHEAFISVMEILSAPDLEDNARKPACKTVQGRFDFQNVDFTYPGTVEHAINQFNLIVEPGQSIAIVGPSGSGKSTVLSLLLGFVRPSAGKILLDGADMASFDLRTYRRHVGVVTQEAVFFSGTILENVAYGYESASDEMVYVALEKANAMEFIEKLPDGLETRMGEGGMKFSGGQLQRLAIARAIIRDPKVLILDEATSALDLESEAVVQKAIESIMRERTTFIVAHRVSTVRNADRVVVLQCGTITQCDSPARLLKTDNFYSHAVRTLQLAQ